MKDINKKINKLTQEHNKLFESYIININSINNHKESLNVASHYMQRAITKMREDSKIMKQIANLLKKRLESYKK